MSVCVFNEWCVSVCMCMHVYVSNLLINITFTDDSSVSVDAHFEDGVLSSSIHFPDDTYVVEVRVFNLKDCVLTQRMMRFVESQTTL